MKCVCIFWAQFFNIFFHIHKKKLHKTVTGLCYKKRNILRKQWCRSATCVNKQESSRSLSMCNRFVTVLGYGWWIIMSTCQSNHNIISVKQHTSDPSSVSMIDTNQMLGHTVGFCNHTTDYKTNKQNPTKKSITSLPTATGNLGGNTPCFCSQDHTNHILWSLQHKNYNSITSQPICKW